MSDVVNTMHEVTEGEPYFTGLLDADGEEIYRIPFIDRVPIGFHYRAIDYHHFYNGTGGGD